jgi:uncharacterized membrane protein
MQSSENNALSYNAAAALCYLLWAITGVAFLLLQPHNRNPRIRFHAFQSIFFTAAFIAGAFVLGLLILIATFVLPFGLVAWIAVLYRVAAVAVWLYLMWSAYQGRDLQLPIIGPLAKKQV